MQYSDRINPYFLDNSRRQRRILTLVSLGISSFFRITFVELEDCPEDKFVDGEKDYLVLFGHYFVSISEKERVIYMNIGNITPS